MHDPEIEVMVAERREKRVQQKIAARNAERPELLALLTALEARAARSLPELARIRARAQAAADVAQREALIAGNREHAEQSQVVSERNYLYGRLTECLSVAQREAIANIDAELERERGRVVAIGLHAEHTARAGALAEARYRVLGLASLPDAKHPELIAAIMAGVPPTVGVSHLVQAPPERSFLDILRAQRDKIFVPSTN